MAKGHKYCINNLLRLDDLKVTEVVGEADEKEKESFCPHCGSKHLYRHGHARPRKVLQLTFAARGYT